MAPRNPPQNWWQRMDDDTTPVDADEHGLPIFEGENADTIEGIQIDVDTGSGNDVHMDVPLHYGHVYMMGYHFHDDDGDDDDNDTVVQRSESGPRAIPASQAAGSTDSREAICPGFYTPSLASYERSDIREYFERAPRRRREVSFFDTHPIDVVDGDVEPESRANSEIDPNPWPSSTNACNSHELLPNVSTDEHFARISNWVTDSSPSACPATEPDCDDANDDLNTIDYVEKLITLAAAKLHHSPLFLSTVESSSELEYECTNVFELVSNLLKANHITEALMQIINVIWNTTEKEKDIMRYDMPPSPSILRPVQINPPKSQELMLMVLNCASPKQRRLKEIEIQRIASHNIFTNQEYFEYISLCTHIKSPSKEFTIFRGIETWINGALQNAFENKTVTVHVDITTILHVITELNQDRNLKLSAEEESKFATKAQRVVREILFERCHSFLKSQGFKFEIVSQKQGMQTYRPGSDRVVPNDTAAAAPGVGQGQSRTRSGTPYDVWLQLELAEAAVALQNDDRNRNSGGSGSHYGTGSSQESVASLREDAYELQGFGNLSQESIQSRMNQGYVSSQSLSQSSLPRLSNSQSSNASEIMRFVNLDNQYVLENQFVPSDTDSSQEPPWKRHRFSNSQ